MTWVCAAIADSPIVRRCLLYIVLLFSVDVKSQRDSPKGTVPLGPGIVLYQLIETITKTSINRPVNVGLSSFGNGIDWPGAEKFNRRTSEKIHRAGG